MIALRTALIAAGATVSATTAVVAAVKLRQVNKIRQMKDSLTIQGRDITVAYDFSQDVPEIARLTVADDHYTVTGGVTYKGRDGLVTITVKSGYCGKLAFAYVAELLADHLKGAIELNRNTAGALRQSMPKG